MRSSSSSSSRTTGMRKACSAVAVDVALFCFSLLHLLLTRIVPLVAILCAGLFLHAVKAAATAGTGTRRRDSYAAEEQVPQEQEQEHREREEEGARLSGAPAPEPSQIISQQTQQHQEQAPLVYPSDLPPRLDGVPSALASVRVVGLPPSFSTVKRDVLTTTPLARPRPPAVVRPSFALKDSFKLKFRRHFLLDRSP